MPHRARLVHMPVPRRVVAARVGLRIVESYERILVAVLESLQKLFFGPFVAGQMVVIENSPQRCVAHAVDVVAPVAHAGVPQRGARILIHRPRVAPLREAQAVARGERGAQRAKSRARSGSCRGIRARQAFLNHHAIKMRGVDITPRHAPCKRRPAAPNRRKRERCASALQPVAQKTFALLELRAVHAARGGPAEIAEDFHPRVRAVVRKLRSAHIADAGARGRRADSEMRIQLILHHRVGNVVEKRVEAGARVAHRVVIRRARRPRQKVVLKIQKVTLRHGGRLRSRVKIPIRIVNLVLRPLRRIRSNRLARLCRRARAGGIRRRKTRVRRAHPLLLARPDAHADFVVPARCARLNFERLRPVHRKLIHAGFDSVHAVVEIGPARRIRRVRARFHHAAARADDLVALHRILPIPRRARTRNVRLHAAVRFHRAVVSAGGVPVRPRTVRGVPLEKIGALRGRHRPGRGCRRVVRYIEIARGVRQVVGEPRFELRIFLVSIIEIRGSAAARRNVCVAQRDRHFRVGMLEPEMRARAPVHVGVAARILHVALAQHHRAQRPIFFDRARGRGIVRRNVRRGA